MSTFVLGMVALGLGLFQDTPVLERELPANAVVAVESLEVFAESHVTSVATDRLRKGETLRVLDFDPISGWLTIVPPAGSIGWVEKRAVRIGDGRRGEIKTDQTIVRAGLAEGRMPGPPGGRLVRGDMVKLVNRPPLTLGIGPSAVSWTAIELPRTELRFTRASGVRWMEDVRNRASEKARNEIQVGFESPSVDAEQRGIKYSSAIARVEAKHRSIIGGPLESWRLESVRREYGSLLDRSPDADAARRIRTRIEEANEQERAARAARTIRTILDRSKRRDEEVASVREKLAQLERLPRRAYVAEGLVQPSSKRVDGRKVYALIGREGRAVAYLDIPPGLDARPLLSKRVGVRGGVRYNESLGARLIAVRDLESLE